MEAYQYKIYVTDALKAIAGNTAKFAGGVSFQNRYYDIMEKKVVKDTRSADEIVNDVLKNAGLEVIE